MAVQNFVELEQDILKKWKAEDVFRKTLAKPSPKGKFVFFEGPPTANGMPHMGHVETRAFKDLFPRFKTMQGYQVDRKAGWDTQGLPVELEVEKAIGISGKQDIEKYGIEKFNEQCRTSVWKYKELWEQMTDRVGFWLDLDKPYVTYENSYIETLWWIFKQTWDAGLMVQDYKVVPYCPRCGTALSSHEVAQGYESVKDRSVYVKFELVDEPGTFVLAWTTTPWTLPGNVALAVGKNVEYEKVTIGNESYIVATDRFDEVIKMQPGKIISSGSEIDEPALTVVWRKKGSELVGLKYKPLFDFLDLRESSIPEPRVVARGELRAGSPKNQTAHLKETPRDARGYENAYTIVPADFVTTEDGTGVVHTAVMYGEDDFQLGSKLDLPKKHTVDLEGKFNELVKPWTGLEVRDEKGETQHKIITWLKENGKLYKEEKYQHDYPFCWRCKHPLLYYAKTSWFITMSKLRDELIANNAKINWVPNHIKDGRFGEWLREVKDWAISRERYWGTPLPIWKCDTCKHQECLGSYEELTKRVPTRNRFIFMRHGQAENAVDGYILNGGRGDEEKYGLTATGRQQVEKSVKRLVKEKPDVLFSSPFRRAKETAGLIAEACDLEVVVDDRLRELSFGPEFENQINMKYHAQFADTSDRFHRAPHGGETFLDARARMFSFLHEIDSKYSGKTIVVVTHGDPMFVVFWALSLRSQTQTGEVEYPESYAEFLEVAFPAKLFRPDGSFDPHRPYIDNVAYPCTECKTGTMTRIPEVADTWYDSGSMPLAQWHYPFENKEKVDSGAAYPAAFISEAIDQTRGWFYTLLAVSTILQRAKKIPVGPPYESCVVLGHIRDKNGKKLSKSAGNYLDPMELINQHGADAVRMYLYTVNQPSEPKNFDEDQLSDVVKKTFIILWNVVSFWKLHATGPASNERSQARNVMDRWILAKLDALTRDVTEQLEAYEVVNAARSLTAFVTELSTWYVRRSRDRAKSDGKAELVATLGYVLGQLSKLMAPFTPFVADALWREIGGQQSVHLEDWPTANQVDDQILKDMEHVREVVETGHALRAQTKLKVRQPLSQVVVTIELLPDLDDILLEELNVKEVQTAKKLPSGKDWVSLNGVALDITVTDELREEGYLREMVRAINATRKFLKLQPGERAALTYSTDNAEAKKMVEHFSAVLREKGSLDTLTYAASANDPAQEARLDDMLVTFGRE